MPSDILTIKIQGQASALTVAQKQAKAAAAISNGASNLFAQNLQIAQNLWAQLWANADSLSPQQVCDSLGNGGDGALSAFTRFSTLTGFLQSNLPANAPAQVVTLLTGLGIPAGYTVTFPVDQNNIHTGHAVVTEPAPA
jgi:hypothetical protein